MDVRLYSGSENFEHSSQFHSAPHLIIFYKYKSYTTKMPRLSRQAKAAAARTRSPNSNRFIDLKKVAENDEYYDMDDDDPQFFHDIGEDEEADIIEDEIQEDEAVLSDEFLNQLRNWRPTGWNSNVRGAGTSRRTHFRNKRKAEDIVISAKSCSTMELYYTPRSNSDSSTAPTASLANTLPLTQSSSNASESIVPAADALSTSLLTSSSSKSATPAIQPPSENMDDDDIFGIVDQCNLFGDDNETDVRGHEGGIRHAHTAQSAIDNLLKNGLQKSFMKLDLASYFILNIIASLTL
jgi:hypothetical protein